MASDILSENWRVSQQPLTRFRQFCDVEEAVGKNQGEKFIWTVYGDIPDTGTAELQENQPMPTGSFPVYDAEVVMTEYGKAVPHTLKYETMSEHNVPNVISVTLKNHANKTFDRNAHAQFDATILRAVGGASGALTLTDNGTPSGTNNIAMSKDHVKTFRDTMEERNIPVFDGEDYVGIMRPTTIRPVQDDLESVFQYVDEGYKRIVNGERGRYEGIRFVTQTNIASEGWSNGLSDAAYFFGADTVTEAIAIPEELRGKIPDDYGRSRGIAWYYLGAFKITHADQTDAASKLHARIIKWDSAA
jgi:N4-gp56 family major capsid protein